MKFMFLVSFDDALNALRRRRHNIAPKVYNNRRLAELPIPDTGENEIDDQRDDGNEEEHTENAEERDQNEPFEVDEEDQHEDDNEGHVENENQSDDEHEDITHHFDSASDDGQIMQGPHCSQNSERALLNVQNNRDENDNTQTIENVTDSLIDDHIDISEQQATSSNTRMDNGATQNGVVEHAVDEHAVESHTFGRCDDLVASNPQKDTVENGEDERAPIADKSSTADQHETAVEKAINSDDSPTTTSPDNSIEEIFLPINAEFNLEFNGEPDEAQINLPNSDLNAIQLNDPIKTEAIPLHEPFHANDNELNELLDEEDMIFEKIDDDLTIIVDSKIGIVKPLNSNVDGLIKREGDVISGNIPFIETVS